MTKQSIIFFQPFACHVRFFASSTLANNRLNLGIIGRYQHPFSRRSSFVAKSSLHSSYFTLYRDTPHEGQLRISENLFLYKIQSLGHECIFWYSILSQPTLRREGDARLTGASSKEGKYAESPPMFIRGKRRKNRKRRGLRTLSEMFGSCIYARGRY